MSDSHFDSAEYERATALYLNSTIRLFEYLSKVEWKEGDRFFPLVARAIFCRQHEALSAIPALVDAGRGYVASTLLRPACEELIVLTYMNRLSADQAERLVVALASLESHDALAAQRGYAGDDAMIEIGFSARFLTAAEQTSDRARVALDALAAELDWPAGRRRPTIRLFAERAELLDVYDFLYHATSRSVHFNVTELLRRAWGTEGAMTISSSHYGGHWTRFALYWGLWIHIHTTLEVIEVVGDLPDSLVGEDMLDALRDLGPQVPIVTPAEFAWQGKRAPWD